MRACVCVCMRACERACACACMPVHACVCIRVGVRECMGVYLCVHACMGANVCTYVQDQIVPFAVSFCALQPLFILLPSFSDHRSRGCAGDCRMGYHFSMMGIYTALHQTIGVKIMEGSEEWVEGASPSERFRWHRRAETWNYGSRMDSEL